MGKKKNEEQIESVRVVDGVIDTPPGSSCIVVEAVSDELVKFTEEEYRRVKQVTVDTSSRLETASKDEVEALWNDFGVARVKSLRGRKLTLLQAREELSK